MEAHIRLSSIQYPGQIEAFRAREIERDVLARIGVAHHAGGDIVI